MRRRPGYRGTVYDPSDGSGDASRLRLPPWPEVVDVLAKLNNGLPAIAEQHRARVAEIHDQFLGHASRSAIRPNPKHDRTTAPSGTTTSSSRTHGAQTPCEQIFWHALCPSR
jgi:hypothetical protein